MRLIGKIMVPVIGVMATSSLFAGCAKTEPENITKEVLFSDAINNFKKNNALLATADLDMDLNIEASGFSINVTGSSKYDVEGDLKNEVIHSVGDTDLEVFGLDQKMHTETYTTREDDSTVTYMCETTTENDSTEWSYKKTATDDVNWLDRIASVNVNDNEFKSQLDEFAKGVNLSSDTSKADGTDCYVVSGVVTLDNDMLSSMAEGTTAITADNKVMADSVWYFNKKNHELKKVELDLASAIDNVSTQVEDVKVTPAKCNIIIYFSYDKKINLSIPADIKDSAKERVDSDNAIKMLTEI